MRSISAGSVVERNNSRWRSTRLSISTHDWHICAMPTDGFGFGFMLVLIRGTFPHGLQLRKMEDQRRQVAEKEAASILLLVLRRRFRLKSAFLIQESERRFRPTIVFESSLGAAVSSLARAPARVATPNRPNVRLGQNPSRPDLDGQVEFMVGLSTGRKLKSWSVRGLRKTNSGAGLPISGPHPPRKLEGRYPYRLRLAAPHFQYLSLHASDNRPRE